MSKKETRRAARQAFPKAPAGGKSSRTAVRSAGGTRKKSGSAAKPALRPPTLKRAAIQGAILAALYLILIRFIWKQENTSTVTYVILPLAGFLVYTGIAYAVDRFTYQRRLRKQKDTSR